MSLNNSLGIEDFNTNVLTSPQQDVHYHPKMFNVASPVVADKMNKFYQSKNNQHIFAQNL